MTQTWFKKFWRKRVSKQVKDYSLTFHHSKTESAHMLELESVWNVSSSFILD